jgi:hypothetical protein
MYGLFNEQTYPDLMYGQLTPAFIGTPAGEYGWLFHRWHPVLSETVTGDTVYVALWIFDPAVPRYTLTYHGNGNTGGSPPEPVTVYENQKVTLASYSDLTRENYVPNGWLTALDVSGDFLIYVPKEQLTVTKNVDLNVLWKEPPMPTPFYYGCLNEVEFLSRMHPADFQTETFNPQDQAGHRSLLETALIITARWINGVLEEHGLPCPLVPEPKKIHDLCDLYAAGLFLSRDTSEGNVKPHEYMVRAEGRFKEFLKAKFGIDVEDKNGPQMPSVFYYSRPRW